MYIEMNSQEEVNAYESMDLYFLVDEMIWRYCVQYYDI